MVASVPLGAGQVDLMNARLLKMADNGARTAPPSPTAMTAHGRSLRVMALLSVLMGFGSTSTDIHLPALPTTGQALQSSSGTMELTFSGDVTDRLAARIPMGRIGASEDIARTVAFLLSDLPTYTTGADFIVDGAYLLRD